MISFEDFIMEDGIPIYMQIINYIKRGAVAGKIKNADELPSRRFLSALLGVNPNTVQKAYRILEQEELLESKVGAKSYMVLSGETILKLRQELLKDHAESIVSAMKQMGISKEQAILLIEKYWGGT